MNPRGKVTEVVAEMLAWLLIAVAAAVLVVGLAHEARGQEPPELPAMASVRAACFDLDETLTMLRGGGVGESCVIYRAPINVLVVEKLSRVTDRQGRVWNVWKAQGSDTYGYVWSEVTEGTEDGQRT